MRLCCAVLLATLLCASLASCAPSGLAVGDTQTVNTTQDHDGVDRSDIRMVVVGTSSASSNNDRELLKQLYNSNIQAVYSASAHVHDGVAIGVRSAVESRASIIMLLLANKKIVSYPSLESALRQARMAGVPVVIMAESDISIDKTLYAARFASGESQQCLSSQAQTQPLDQALISVIDDKPHADVMCIAADG